MALLHGNILEVKGNVVDFVCQDRNLYALYFHLCYFLLYCGVEHFSVENSK